MKKIFAASLFAMSLTAAVAAVGPSVWSVNSRAEVMRGDARGVMIDDNGSILLAPRLTEVFRTDQPYIWSSLVDSAGNVYLGTGSDGKIFKVEASGRGALFADLPELNVAALAFGRGGELFAATSPDGKVYRVDGSGRADVYFDPKQKYIWSLALLSDGSLAVGTGESGRIYRVRTATASPESSLLFDTSETHIISLAADNAGNLFAGTDPGGMVLKFGADGKPFALLDSPLREVHEIAVGPDSVYALALGESIAAAKPPETTATPSSAPGNVPAPSSAQAPPKSRYDLSGARSAVYRIFPDGNTELIWASSTAAGFSLYAHQTGNGVMVGTSDKGRIFSITNHGRETLVLQTDASQVSTIRSAGTSLLATSSNQGILYRFGGGPFAEGSYESSVLDAKATAQWGRVWWRSTGNVLIQTRSGNTESPNETWSSWAAAAGTGSSGQVSSPPARFLQWRAMLRAGQPEARLDEVNVAFLPRNIAPEVLSIQVLPTNVGLVPTPGPQIDPNIALSGLEPSALGLAMVVPQPRRLYQRGATSLTWTAEDRNGDKLVYDVFYREVGDMAFRPLRENIEENFLTIDGQSLADGRYVFRIVAKDSAANPAGMALSGERVTEPIDIDNTAPLVTVASQPIISGSTARVTFSASDRSSYLTRAEFSVNGSDWRTVYADDGISDSPEERYTVAVPLLTAGEYVVTLRVFDVNGNSGNARAVVKR